VRNQHWPSTVTGSSLEALHLQSLGNNHGSRVTIQERNLDGFFAPAAQCNESGEFLKRFCHFSSPSKQLGRTPAFSANMRSEMKQGLLHSKLWQRAMQFYLCITLLEIFPSKRTMFFLLAILMGYRSLL